MLLMRSRRNAMSKKLMAAALVLGVSMLPVAAIAGGWGGGGGGGSGSSDGDWALRDELKNPRLIQPGSPYGYDRSYARGAAPWRYPPAYQVHWPFGPPYQVIEERHRPGAATVSNRPTGTRAGSFRKQTGRKRVGRRGRGKSRK